MNIKAICYPRKDELIKGEPKSLLSSMFLAAFPYFNSKEDYISKAILFKVDDDDISLKTKNDNDEYVILGEYKRNDIKEFDIKIERDGNIIWFDTKKGHKEMVLSKNTPTEVIKDLIAYFKGENK